MSEARSSSVLNSSLGITERNLSPHRPDLLITEKKSEIESDDVKPESPVFPPRGRERSRSVHGLELSRASDVKTDEKKRELKIETQSPVHDKGVEVKKVPVSGLTSTLALLATASGPKSDTKDLKEIKKDDESEEKKEGKQSPKQNTVSADMREALAQRLQSFIEKLEKGIKIKTQETNKKYPLSEQLVKEFEMGCLSSLTKYAKACKEKFKECKITYENRHKKKEIEKKLADSLNKEYETYHREILARGNDAIDRIKAIEENKLEESAEKKLAGKNLEELKTSINRFKMGSIPNITKLSNAFVGKKIKVFSDATKFEEEEYFEGEKINLRTDELASVRSEDMLKTSIEHEHINKVHRKLLSDLQNGIISFDGLAKEADVAFLETNLGPDKLGNNELHYACWLGNMVLAKQIMQLQPVLKLQKPLKAQENKNGLYPIQYLLEKNHATLEFVKFLEPTTKELKAVDSFGRNAFAAAAFLGKLDILNYFIELATKEKKKPTKNCKLAIALNVAAGCGHIDIVQYLLNLGRGNFTVEDYQNALGNAYYNGRIDVVFLFMDRGYTLGDGDHGTVALKNAILDCKTNPEAKMNNWQKVNAAIIGRIKQRQEEELAELKQSLAASTQTNGTAPIAITSTSSAKTDEQKDQGPRPDRPLVIGSYGSPQGVSSSPATTGMFKVVAAEIKEGGVKPAQAVSLAQDIRSDATSTKQRVAHV